MVNIFSCSAPEKYDNTEIKAETAEPNIKPTMSNVMLSLTFQAVTLINNKTKIDPAVAENTIAQEVLSVFKVGDVFDLFELQLGS